MTLADSGPPDRSPINLGKMVSPCLSSIARHSNSEGFSDTQLFNLYTPPPPPPPHKSIALSAASTHLSVSQLG